MNSDGPQYEPPGIVEAATLGVWIVCLAVGILGLTVRYPGAHLPRPQAAPVVAQMMTVDLPEPPAPAQAPAAAAVAAEPSPPLPAVAPALPDAPPLTPVATPSPAIAFAVPVEGPTRIVDAKQAAPQPKTVAAPAPAQAPAARRLTFGVGEGNQPDPDYPRQAMLAHEEGTVTVRFTVNEQGRVIAAELLSPSRWPSLNQSALRTIRERWHFGGGPVRTYEISIQFQLK